jgi:hypothetical protein
VLSGVSVFIIFGGGRLGFGRRTTTRTRLSRIGFHPVRLDLITIRQCRLSAFRY